MKKDNCLFCKIIAGEIPSTVVFENEKVFAFKDINPQAPVHIVIVPKDHIDCADDITAGNSCGTRCAIPTCCRCTCGLAR